MLPLLAFMQGRDICSKKFSVWPSRLLVWMVDALTGQFTFFLNAQYFDAVGDLLPTKENDSTPQAKGVERGPTHAACPNYNF